MKRRKRFLKKDLNSYKDKLVGLREEVAREVNKLAEELMKSREESSGDISTHNSHLADSASGSFERDFSLGVASSEMQTLRKIDLALRKIDDSNYGVCESCEKPIPKRRLNAIPYVRFCMKCQEKMDNDNGRQNT